MALLAATLTVAFTGVAASPAGADPVQTPRSSVSAGWAHACGVTQAGGVVCWGSNAQGQLGNGTTTSSSVPVAVTGLGSGVASVSAGPDLTCALTTAGGVKCWGSNAQGQLGNGTTTSSSVPVDVVGLSSGVKAISTGGELYIGFPGANFTRAHVCALLSTGGLKCWGRNNGGQLGNGATANSSVPVDVVGLSSGVASIAAAGAHTCAITTAGAAKCWGLGTAGELGNGVLASSSVPVDVVGLSSGVAAMDGGRLHTCAVMTSGAVKCWGDSLHGELGNGTSGVGARSSLPVNVTGLGAGVVAIASGGYHSCALTSAGAVRCWGGGDTGQLGDGQLVNNAPVPVAVSGLASGAVALSGGGQATCALRTTGAIACWGDNSSGQLGRSAGTSSSVPINVAGVAAGASIDGGGVHTCAVTTSGGVVCWGNNGTGQLGDGTLVDSAGPVAVSGLASGVSMVASGDVHSCAVTQAGGVVCWGDNSAGQLGNGTTTDSSVPVAVTGLASGVVSVTAGSVHTCALTATGGVLCWGSNTSGRLGDGTTTASLIPVSVVGLSSGATGVSAGTEHTCAIDAAGAALCWGKNTFGRLGDGTTTDSWVPRAVTGLSSGVTSVTASSKHSCAVVGGAVVCWGNNDNGRLGNGTTTSSSVPVNVVGTSSGAAAVTSAGTFSCALSTAGAVTCWGDNQFGRLGDGTTTGSLVPVPVTGLGSGVVAVSASLVHSCAVASTGAVSCWGDNRDRQLGSIPSSWVPGEVSGGPAYGPGSVAGPTIVGDRTPAANGSGWNNEPVTVSFTCASDALAACTAPVTVSTDGAGQSVAGTGTDLYGQSTSVTVSGISIDRVAPTLAGLATTAPNGDGWYRAPVTMAWTCDDDRSGVASCPSDSVTVGEGSAVSVSSSISDRAGNVTTANSESVQVDLTAPSTGVTSPPTWSSQDVTLILTPTDGLSGVASTNYRVDGGSVRSGTAAVVSGQGVHAVQFWSTDVAGNVEAPGSVTVRIDVTAPSITPQVSPLPNGNGWHKGPVEVTFTCADSGGSDVASCTGDASFATEVDTVVTGNVADAAGNAASAQATVRIDLHAPTVIAQVPSANGYGWFNTQVQVPFSCSDTGGSGVDACPEPAMFAGEGADQPVSASGTDNAGNVGSASGATVSLDLTAPTISGAALEAPNGTGGYTGTVHVHFTCDDALSGVVACPADEVVSGEGVHVVSGSVTDRAGNTSSAEVTVRIDHDASNDPGAVHGTITDAVTGQPAAGVLVRLHDPANLATRYSATTGTDGTYLLPIVADGTYLLSTTRSGVYLQAWFPSAATSGGAQSLTVAHGTDRTADVAMTPGYVLAGSVTDAVTGQPLSGASVLLSNGTRGTTDAGGRYEIKGLSTATLGITFIAYGHSPESTSVAVPGVSMLDRALSPTPDSSGIKGVITSLTPGGPLAGATVRVWPKDAGRFSVTVATDAQGRYSLPTLPSGSYQVDVVRGDYRVRWAADAPDRTGAATITVTPACTATPDASWGIPCATPVNIRMRQP